VELGGNSSDSGDGRSGGFEAACHLVVGDVSVEGGDLVDDLDVDPGDVEALLEGPECRSHPVGEGAVVDI